MENTNTHLKPQHPIRILWAVDPFDDIPETENKVVRTLRDFATHGAVEIYPVYVLSPGLLDSEFEASMRWPDDYLTSLQKSLDFKMKDLVIPGLQKSKVVIESRFSLKSATETLWKQAELHQCQFIVVSSHSRKGFQRLMLGSFAETLFLTSPIPVMIVGPRSAKTKSSAHPSMNILIPNDLSNPHSSFFDRIFGITKYFKANATVLYAAAQPLEAVIQSGVYLVSGGWPVTAGYAQDDRKAQQKAFEKIESKAKQFEIPVHCISDEASKSVTESVLKYVEENQVDLIAMAAESGPVASALIGSITRQIVRIAPCPVIVLRSSNVQPI